MQMAAGLYCSLGIVLRFQVSTSIFDNQQSAMVLYAVFYGSTVLARMMQLCRLPCGSCTIRLSQPPLLLLLTVLIAGADASDGGHRVGVHPGYCGHVGSYVNCCGQAGGAVHNHTCCSCYRDGGQFERVSCEWHCHDVVWTFGACFTAMVILFPTDYPNLLNAACDGLLSERQVWIKPTNQYHK